jgi:hypothetical protein
MEQYFGVTPPTVGFSLYRRKSPEFWLLHNPAPHAAVYLNNY